MLSCDRDPAFRGRQRAERVERYAADSITEGKDLYAVIMKAVTATS